MTKQFSFLRARGLLIGLIALAGAGQATAAPFSIDYFIGPYHTDIVDSWLFDINNQGRSTGYMVVHPAGGGFPRAAVTYRAGDTQLVALSSNPGGSLGLTGFAINNLGDVVGNVDDQPQFFSAGGGAAVPIEIPGQIASLFVASNIAGGLNDSGNALVSIFPIDPADTPPSGFSGLAIWNATTSTVLSALNPLYQYVNPPDPNDYNSGPSSSAGTVSVTHLNNSNQFAASIHQYDYDPKDPVDPNDDVFNEYFTHAYVYDGQGGYKFLESPTPGDEVRPIDIDEMGKVFGWVGNQLALWGADGALQSILPAPATALDDVGYGGFPTVQRNNLGQIVGVTADGGVMFYDPVSNAWTDITSSINGLGTGTFSTIQGFNDLGQFVGLARPPQGGGVFGYVVSSVPEPTSLAICGMGLVVAVMLRGRLRR